MIYIQKRQSPEWFEKYKESISRYEDIDDEHRRKLREELISEQYGLCGYCCSKINVDKSINEHIIPRNKNIDGLDYSNLMASCRGQKDCGETCGHKKKGKFDEEKFVSPLHKNCEEQFVYTADGRIVGLNNEATYTINLLNLNSYSLQRARQHILNVCLKMNEKTVALLYDKPMNGTYLPYCDIIKYFLNEGIFKTS